MTLTDLDRQILDVAATLPNHPGKREIVIFDAFGVLPARYFQALNRLLDDPAAVVEYPVLIHRLRRQRDAARQARSARRLPA